MAVLIRDDNGVVPLGDGIAWVGTGVGVSVADQVWQLLADSRPVTSRLRAVASSSDVATKAIATSSTARTVATATDAIAKAAPSTSTLRMVSISRAACQKASLTAAALTAAICTRTVATSTRASTGRAYMLCTARTARQVVAHRTTTPVVSLASNHAGIRLTLGTTTTTI